MFEQPSWKTRGEKKGISCHTDRLISNQDVRVFCPSFSCISPEFGARFLCEICVISLLFWRSITLTLSLYSMAAILFPRGLFWEYVSFFAVGRFVDIDCQWGWVCWFCLLIPAKTGNISVFICEEETSFFLKHGDGNGYFGGHLVYVFL